MGAPPKDLRRRVNEIGPLMDKLGLSEHELAVLVGTTYTNVNRHKLGRAIPDLDHAFAYSKALGVSIEGIFFPRGCAEWAGGGTDGKECPIARRVRTTSGEISDLCGACGRPCREHGRIQGEAPHPNDWRRKMAQDEIALVCAIAKQPASRGRVTNAIRELKMTNKRAFAILGAWTDWGWYEPGRTVLSGDMTAKGITAARLMVRGK